MPKALKPNSLVTGTLVQITNEGAFVDIGSKADSILPCDELEASGLKAGDTATFLIVGEPNEDGQVRLSHKSAIGWTTALELHQSQATTEQTVISLVRPRGGNHIAGATVEINGARGFVPASQIAVRGKALERLVGSKLALKVIEANLGERKLVLSNRAAVEELRSKFFASAEAGQFLTGNVTGFGSKKLQSGQEVEYGAFVDLGNGVSGLVHKSEITDDRSATPSSLLTLGQQAELVILSVDKDTQQVSLSLKKARSARFFGQVKEGDVLSGKAARRQDFGWFVSLGDGAIDGLLHKAEIAEPNGLDAFKAGETVTVVIKSLDIAREKVGLSTRGLPKS